MFEESGVTSDAVYNGDNITFNTSYDLSTVKAQLDLRDFDMAAKSGAKFTITITEQVEEGTTVAPEETTEAPGVVGVDFVIIGDVTDAEGVTFDGEVTIDDATEIQKAGIELVDFTFPQKLAGDVNGDGRISILDVTCVQKFLAEYTKGIGHAGEKVTIEES